MEKLDAAAGDKPAGSWSGQAMHGTDGSRIKELLSQVKMPNPIFQLFAGASWEGMPELVPFEDSDRWKRLKNHVVTYLERNLEELTSLEDLSTFHAFEKLSAFRSSNLLNFSEPVPDAYTCVDTSRRYCENPGGSCQRFFLKSYCKKHHRPEHKTPGTPCLHGYFTAADRLDIITRRTDL
ncbi:hypothetical protein Dthio_PD2051 [Desulfonatronospira thiodismutans ASO3-1]|uniref:Uncharacterized protein n=2 Tax=Desulfonatronospira thiodismutans TaxID=488939 RepID=D6SPK3_9BACT|nr:hypothetical protein Dthio_PD2051 [Desulfonatronospira thiodismutans ASO3-1]